MKHLDLAQELRTSWVLLLQIMPTTISPTFIFPRIPYNYQTMGEKYLQ